MNTPLLADEEGQDRPSLSSGPWMIPPEDELSDFSRLLAQRATPPPELLEPLIAPRNTTNRTNEVSSNETRIRRSPLLITAAATCSLLHLGLVWGALMSDSWSSTSITVWTNWEESQVRWPLRTIHLASFLQDLDAAHLYLLELCLWMTSLLLPCLFMILMPSWIIKDANNSILMPARQREWRRRGLLECSVRWALLVFYVLIVLSAVVGSLRVEWTGTVVTVQTRALGGLVCFPVGIGLALLAVMLLRWPQKTVPPRGHASQQQPTLPNMPPADAFVNSPWHLLGGDLDEAPAMTVLEDGPLVEPARSPEPLTAQESGGVDTSTTTDSSSASPRGRRFDRVVVFLNSHLFRSFFVYQMGLLSIVLWAPSLFLPVAGWTSSGILSDLEDKTTGNLFLVLWELPPMLWNQAIAANTAKTLLILAGSVFLTTVYFVPTAAMLLACCAWFMPRQRQNFRGWLYCIHPLLGSGVFCVAVLLAIPALESWSDVVLSLGSSRGNEGSIGNLFLLEKDGLSIKGEFRPTIWLFLVQSFALEAFVVLTLRWS